MPERTRAARTRSPGGLNVRENVTRLIVVAGASYYEASHGLCRQPVIGRRTSIGDAAEADGSSSRPLDWHSSGGRGNYGRRMANRYEYTVVELREGMIGGKMSGDKLENVLNEHAAQGWQLKAITSVEVKGRVGPGGVEGLLVTFERPVG
jgi:hypothetical protein